MNACRELHHKALNRRARPGIEAEIYHPASHGGHFATHGEPARPIAWPTGVPAMIGAKMIVEGKWKKSGGWNMEQHDPDPFMADMNKYGLPWQEKCCRRTTGEHQRVPAKNCGMWCGCLSRTFSQSAGGWDSRTFVADVPAGTRKNKVFALARVSETLRHASH